MLQEKTIVKYLFYFHNLNDVDCLRLNNLIAEDVDRRYFIYEYTYEFVMSELCYDYESASNFIKAIINIDENIYENDFLFCLD